MKPKLSKRKRKQVNRIIATTEKMRRLMEWAQRKGNELKVFVLEVNIEGKKCVIKISPNERIQRKNLLLLQREHTKAVRNGTIKPIYSLSIVKYIHLGPEASVMEKVPGFGTDALKHALLIEKKDKEALSTKQLSPILSFCRKHPEITLKSITVLKSELRKNLKKVSGDRTRFSYDVDGFNNIIVNGFNRKTGKFKITLVDQVFPYGDLNHMKEIVLKGLGKKSKS